MCFGAKAEIIELQMNSKMAKTIGSILIKEYGLKASDFLFNKEQLKCEKPKRALIKLCSKKGEIIRQKATARLAEDLNQFFNEMRSI